MNPCPHRISQRCIYRLMALDESFTFKRITHDHRLEMVATAGSVTHLDVRARQAKFD